MKTKNGWNETLRKCEKCGSETWFFMLEDKEGNITHCNDCPKYVERVTRQIILKYTQTD